MSEILLVICRWVVLLGISGMFLFVIGVGVVLFVNNIKDARAFKRGCKYPVFGKDCEANKIIAAQRMESQKLIHDLFGVIDTSVATSAGKKERMLEEEYQKKIDAASRIPTWANNIKVLNTISELEMDEVFSKCGIPAHYFTVNGLDHGVVELQIKEEIDNIVAADMINIQNKVCAAIARNIEDRKKEEKEIFIVPNWVEDFGITEEDFILLVREELKENGGDGTFTGLTISDFKRYDDACSAVKQKLIEERLFFDEQLKKLGEVMKNMELPSRITIPPNCGSAVRSEEKCCCGCGECHRN